MILLDEAQSLPSGFLDPILEALSELVANYRCSVVLSTATQPALKRREALPGGFAEITEIIPDPASLGRELVRVGVEWPNLKAPPVEWQDLADELAEYDQVLAVVHRRGDARILAGLLPEDGTHHLSALMCAKHRLEVINKVRDRPKTGQICRLVSTQLIEAGVDVDFPIVYRALAGLDNVVQAAGRCNREGRLDSGRVVVFKAPTTPPRGTPTKGLEATISMLRQYPGGPDPHSPAICEEYFRGLYARLEKDAKNIQRERQEFNFALTAAKFRLIDDAHSTPIVVPYADSGSRVDACRHDLTRENLRALQPFLVTIYEPDLRLLEQAGAIELVGDVVRSLTDAFAHLYSKRFGLCVGTDPQPDPDHMIV